MRAAEEKQYKRQNDYNDANYDRVTIFIPKGDKEKLKAAAQERGQSVNALLKEIIKKELDI